MTDPEHRDSGGLGDRGAAFRVVREKTVPVTTYRKIREVVVETDDWIEAERAASPTFNRGGGQLRIEGTHPTHDFRGESWRHCFCHRCGSPQGGCYMSHAPCGFDFEGKPLISFLEEKS